PVPIEPSMLPYGASSPARSSRVPLTPPLPLGGAHRFVRDPVAGEELCREVAVAAGHRSRSRPSDKPAEEGEVVDRRKAVAKELVVAKEVVEISGAEARAGHAAAALLDGPIVRGEAGVADVDPASGG